MKKYLPLRPPVYNSLEENYKATLVYTLSWAWIFGVTIIISAMIAVLPAFIMRGAGVIGSIDTACIICLLLNRKGNTRLASAILPVTLWVLATLLALTAGGIYAPAVVAYLPVIITSGFLLGGFWGVMMAALCLLSALGFVILGSQGILPAIQVVHTPFTLWLSYSVTGVLVAVMQYLATKHILFSFQTIARETEERKQAETRLRESEFNNRMVVENKILGVAWASPEGRILKASAKFCEMLGYAEHELKGVYFGDFTHPDDVILEVQQMDRIDRHEIDSYSLEKRYKHKSGRYFWVELNLTAYHNAETGKVDFYIGIVQNIQQRKQAEEALRLSETAIRGMNDLLEKRVRDRTLELEIVNRDLSPFNSMLSHDLRGAIRRVKSFGEILSRKMIKSHAESDVIESLELIKRDAAKMEGIVTGLLEMSKLGSKPVQLKLVDLNKTVEGVLTDVKKHWPENKHEVSISPLPVLNSDALLMQQIFTNLLSNAFKYASKNEVIKVDITYTDNSDHYIFSITDNGVGFDMADHDKLFKGFVRLHSDADYEGTGIGLNSVKRFVEKLGGRIWAESYPAGGSTFHFVVPLQEFETGS